MKRFVTVLAAVALGAAIYVATAPGSQTAGPTAAQFKALQKQVTKLQKDEGQVKQLAIAEAFLLNDCMAASVPIGQYGDGSDGSTTGYTYTDPTINSGTPFYTTALDVAGNTDPNALWITGGTSACGTDLNPAGALRKLTRLAGIRLHGAVPHAFSAHRP